ncbi:MAG: ferredoxin family protein [Anaerolineae bacterium]|nr:ferredoxin family protein [Anaerolineae bacterium]
MKKLISLQHQAETSYIILNTGRCKACWACVDVCPQHVFGKVDFLFHRHARIDQPENCQGCLLCLDACSHQAILSIEKTHDNISL